MGFFICMVTTVRQKVNDFLGKIYCKNQKKTKC